MVVLRTECALRRTDALEELPGDGGAEDLTSTKQIGQFTRHDGADVADDVWQRRP